MSSNLKAIWCVLWPLNPDDHQPGEWTPRFLEAEMYAQKRFSWRLSDMGLEAREWRIKPDPEDEQYWELFRDNRFQGRYRSLEVAMDYARLKSGLEFQEFLKALSE